MNRLMVWGILTVSFGCRTHSVQEPNPVLENGETGLRSWEPDTASADSGAWTDSNSGPDIGDEPDPETLEPSWCIDWESGTLEDAGYSGSQVELKDGAIVLVAEEGQEYSALIGEDQLDYGGSHTLVLRSSHLGDKDSVAILQTEPFDVEHPHLWWSQLSEVRAEGIAIEAQLIDANTAQVMARLDLPVETGGFVPALQDTHAPIEGFPEIDYGSPSLGVMVMQTVDMSAFQGLRVSLRIAQHTRVEDNGFFTLIDDICVGHNDSAALEWVSEP